MYSKLLAMFIRDVRKNLSAPKMPFVIGVMGIGGVKEDKKPGDQKYFRQAQAAPAGLPEFKGNVVAVQTAPYWDDYLESLQGRMNACWPKVDARVAEEMKKEPKAGSWENKMKIMAEYLTPKEWIRLKATSNGGGATIFSAPPRSWRRSARPLPKQWRLSTETIARRWMQPLLFHVNRNKH